MIVSDDHGGLKAAIIRHLQSASHQKCQIHYARKLPGMVKAARRKEFAADLRRAFAASNRRSALGLASSAAEKQREKDYPKVAEHMEGHIEECLICLAFPESHRRRTRA